MNLPYLRHLELSNNWFAPFPAAVCSITTLTELDASICRALMTVHQQPFTGPGADQLARLQNLEVLRLKKSSLDSITPDIHVLTRLRILSLDDNLIANVCGPKLCFVPSASVCPHHTRAHESHPHYNRFRFGFGHLCRIRISGPIVSIFSNAFRGFGSLLAESV